MHGSGAFMPTTPVVAAPDVASSGLPLVEPVSLTPRSDPFDDPEWVFEPKYDGFRGLLYGTAQGCAVQVPQEIGRRVGDLWSRVADVLRGREVILDGEIVSLDRKGRPIFQQLLRGEGYLAFAAYDLLWEEGLDLRDRPLAERKGRLAELLPEDTGPLYKVLTIEEHGRALFGAIRRMDLGGIVAKCRNHPYGPATVWYEIRSEGRVRARPPLTSIPRPA
jgi:ATP-dependent DNA ligase